VRIKNKEIAHSAIKSYILLSPTNIRTNAMYNLVWKFTKILSIVKKNLIDVLDEHGNLTRPGNKPKFSDAEVITLSLLSEALMFDSEHYLFKFLNKNFKAEFPNLIDRSGL